MDMETATSNHAIEIDADVLDAFLDETRESLESLDPLFVRLEQEPRNQDVASSIFRPIHSIKGSAPFFGLTKIKTLAHEIESLLALVRDRKIRVEAEVISILLQGVDSLKKIVERARGREPEVADENGFQALVKKIKECASGSSFSSEAIWNSVMARAEKLKATIQDPVLSGVFSELLKDLASLNPLSKQTKPASEATAQDKPIDPSSEKAKTGPSERPESTEATRPGAEAQRTMRVPEDRIDTFLSFVGELIGIGEMLNNLRDRLGKVAKDQSMMTELRRVTEGFVTLSSKLEHAIMSIRKVPAKGVFQKVPRLVRDIAVARGKDIKVEISGEDVEVDKSLVELLDAPLTHMVRNAADHGIETPEVRKAAGKPSQGKILVDCEEKDRHIVLTIQDDGAGLNYKALQKKGESLGLFPPGQQASREQLTQLIFLPGVSTAEVVSDVSGRGVGMDVVKRSIESAGGSIEVLSEDGKGTKFCMNLVKSVTTEIRRGFIVSFAGEYFIFPLERVLDCLFVPDEKITTLVGAGRCIHHYGEAVPLVTLGDVLEKKKRGKKDAGELVVTIERNKDRLAVGVDEVVGVNQFVLKSIENAVCDVPLFAGGALMGDGRVALVLDIEKIPLIVP